MAAHSCTEAIHEALCDDQALAALPSWLARAAGARSAMLQWRHRDGVHEIIAFNHYSAASAALYAWKYAPIDPWVKAALASPRRGELLRLDDCVPAATFERSRLYREFIRPQGDDTFHATVAVFATVWGEGLLSLHRGRCEAPFSQSDIDPLSACLPHLDRLMRARGEVIARRRREQVVRDTLDGVALGAIVVGAEGQIVRANLAADQVLRRADGFRTRGSGLSCADPGSRLRLQAAVALATAPDNPMATAIPVERVVMEPGAGARRERPLAYMVSVTPMPGEGDGPRAMLVFRDPDGPEETLAGRLRALLRTSRAEPGIAVGLPDGLISVRVSAAPAARA